MEVPALSAYSSAARALALAAFLALSTTACREQSMISLSASEIASSQIVVPSQPSEPEARAAAVLQQYIERITGATMPVVDDSAAPREVEILVGRNARLAGLGVDVDVAVLAEDGFTLRTVGTRLVIAGGSEKGTLYGAYALLEDYLGCRKYSPEVEHVPRRKRLEIPAIDTTQVPAIRFRQVYYRLARDPAYAEWHRLDDQAEDWGMWVHTFAPLLSPDEYFASHPEYFAQVAGKRVSSGQLCLTNPEVLEIVVAALRERMAVQPRAHYWSVSQNDTYGYCECDRCRAIDEREGSPSGSLLTFVNLVATRFPDKTISTLAYQYGRAAPRNVRPAANVNIVLCSIECNRSQPIASDPSSESFRRDVEDWSRICDNILVWDYVIQFANLVSPFPNLRVLQPNIRYFVDNHSVAMFQQGNRELGGEFAELRAYLIAKLLWNPDADPDTLMDDFLDGYYGKAGPHIRRYIDRMHDALAESGQRLDIFGNPVAAASGYLAPGLLSEYESCFDRAEAAVADEPRVLDRVRFARLPLHYARLEQTRARGAGEDGMFRRAGDGAWAPRPEVLERLDAFTALCNRQGITRVTEWHTTPDEYRDGYLALLQRPPLDHLASGRPVELAISFSPKYPADGPATLTDGVRGPLTHAYGWLGFEGTDMEARVELREPAMVRRLSSDFLQSAASWIFLPERVEYALSLDGQEFTPVAVVERRADPRQGGVFIEEFAAEVTPQKARHVRVRAVSAITCPDWHIGAGGPSWIFVDELMVE